GARTVKRYLEDRVGSLLAEHVSRAGRAAMQVIRIYGGDDGAFRVHVGPLEEAAPHAEASELAPLLAAPTSALRAHAEELAHRLAGRSAAPAREARRAHPALLYYADWYEERVQRLLAELG